MDEIDALTPKFPLDKTCELTYLEITLTEFWGEGMGTQPGAPDGDQTIYERCVIGSREEEYQDKIVRSARQ